jgi:hypothetical protein
MTCRCFTTALRLVLPTLAILIAHGPACAEQELEQKASWAIPAPAEVKAQVDAFLQSRSLDEPTRAQIAALWNDEALQKNRSSEELLDLVATTLGLVDTNAQQVVDFCRTTAEVTTLPDFAVLKDDQQPALMRNNLRLIYGRWLATHECYDEAIEQLQGLATTDVVDPAALLFYQCVAYQRMPDKRQCLPLVTRLLERQQEIPRRYLTLAQLIHADIKPLESDSLDEISRLMDEVRRRLALRRAGTRVRQQEDEVVAKLDKLIKKVEEQQQQQAAAAAATLQPSNPAQDSMPMGGKGPGNIDPKEIGRKSGWGNMPPAQRQEALQQIGKDLPAHYREVLEEYFRRLAREEGSQ